MTIVPDGLMSPITSYLAIMLKGGDIYTFFGLFAYNAIIVGGGVALRDLYSKIRN